MISLRFRAGAWEPLTALCLPTRLFPFRGESACELLMRLGTKIRIPEFFGPATDFPSEFLHRFPIHGVELQTDFESHWRQNGYWKTIRSIRNRTDHLRLRADGDGDLDWILDQWVRQWEGDAQDMRLVADEMGVLWSALKADGPIHTVALIDEDGTQLAGAIDLIENGTVIGLCTSRVTDRPKLSLGTRLIDASCSHYRDSGLEVFDLGGWSDYKHRLAPEIGSRYLVDVSPRPVVLVRRLLRR